MRLSAPHNFFMLFMNNRILFILLFVCGISFAQKEITWFDLSKVKFENKYIPEYDDYYLFPNFSAPVKALDGAEVTITGYFLDIDPKGEIFVLSKGPMSSCFFCGIGGPETAVEVHFKSKPSFKMDDIVTVSGIFELNSDDVDHFNYILRDASGALTD